MVDICRWRGIGEGDRLGWGLKLGLGVEIEIGVEVRSVWPPTRRRNLSAVCVFVFVLVDAVSVSVSARTERKWERAVEPGGRRRVGLTTIGTGVTVTGTNESWLWGKRRAIVEETVREGLLFDGDIEERVSLVGGRGSGEAGGEGGSEGGSEGGRDIAEFRVLEAEAISKVRDIYGL